MCEYFAWRRGLLPDYLPSLAALNLAARGVGDPDPQPILIPVPRG